MPNIYTSRNVLLLRAAVYVVNSQYWLWLVLLGHSAFVANVDNAHIVSAFYLCIVLRRVIVIIIFARVVSVRRRRTIQYGSTAHPTAVTFFEGLFETWYFLWLRWIILLLMLLMLLTVEYYYDCRSCCCLLFVSVKSKRMLVGCCDCSHRWVRRGKRRDASPVGRAVNGLGRGGDDWRL